MAGWDEGGRELAAQPAGAAGSPFGVAAVLAADPPPVMRPEVTARKL